MKEIFQKLALKGYPIYNKRVLGNPLYTSEETRLRDITQEIALVVEWLRVNHGIWVYCKYQKRGTVIFIIEDLQGNNITISPDFNSPQEAYSEAITYCLEKII
jgi:hypothetical protein